MPNISKNRHFPNLAHFQFYGSLQDFLPAVDKEKLLPYLFQGKPAVKDTLEALGVPHPEVSCLLVNRQPADFSYQLQSGDSVAVFPFHYSFPHKLVSLQKLPRHAAFVLDVHLGKLARNLRMLGFDCLYANDYTDQQIAALAAGENRIVLSRDKGLLKHKAVRYGYWLRSQQEKEQLQEVLRHFQLGERIQAFSRCLSCNGPITEVEKEKVREQLPPKTRQYFHTFYQCGGCRKVYWQGSHYDRMQAAIQQMNLV